MIYAWENGDGSISLSRRADSAPEAAVVVAVENLPDTNYRDAFEISGDAIVINAAKQAKIDARNAARAEQAANKADSAIKQIITASNQEIDDYIDANVTNLAQARTFLKRLTKAVSAIGREAFENE